MGNADIIGYIAGILLLYAMYLIGNKNAAGNMLATVASCVFVVYFDIDQLEQVVSFLKREVNKKQWQN